MEKIVGLIFICFFSEGVYAQEYKEDSLPHPPQREDFRYIGNETHVLLENGNIYWIGTHEQSGNEEIFFFDGQSGVVQVTDDGHGKKMLLVNQGGQFAWVEEVNGTFSLNFFNGESHVKIRSGLLSISWLRLSENGTLLWLEYDSVLREAHVNLFNGNEVKLLDSFGTNFLLEMDVNDLGQATWNRLDVSNRSQFTKHFDGLKTHLLTGEGEAGYYYSNRRGDLAWTVRDSFEDLTGTLFYLIDGIPTVIDEGVSSAVLNENGQITWVKGAYSDEMRELFFFDGSNLSSIGKIEAPSLLQKHLLNDAGDMVIHVSAGIEDHSLFIVNDGMISVSQDHLRAIGTMMLVDDGALFLEFKDDTYGQMRVFGLYKNGRFTPLTYGIVAYQASSYQTSGNKAVWLEKMGTSNVKRLALYDGEKMHYSDYHRDDINDVIFPSVKLNENGSVLVHGKEGPDSTNYFLKLLRPVKESIFHQ